MVVVILIINDKNSSGKSESKHDLNITIFTNNKFKDNNCFVLKIICNTYGPNVVVVAATSSSLSDNPRSLFTTSLQK